MKKKTIFAIFMIVLAVCTQCVFVDAIMLNTDQTPNNPNGGAVINGVKTTADNAWATIAVLVQIVSVACVVFAGLRYMFASADQKADIKQGLIYLAIGAILVFGATTIIKAVATAAETVIEDGTTPAPVVKPHGGGHYTK